MTSLGDRPASSALASPVPGSATSSRVGVLLVNLGTPDAPTAKAVRLYLAEFLSDRRVVEIPRLIWQPILRGVILNTRPRKSAHAYGQVWTEDGSPLAAITAQQAAGLQVRLGDHVRVGWAMRYGNPPLAREMTRMLDDGCERILIAPLYPQYSAATTASAMDAAFAGMVTLRRQPALRTLPPYFDDPGHIEALRTDIARQIANLPFAPEVLLLSFHGMPQRTHELGDPYYRQCLETARLLTAALGPVPYRVEVSFQSRFGRAKWLEPATDVTLEQEAKRGTRRLAIVAPGFSADCLETREELAIRGRESFLEAGGSDFAALDCLNAGDAGMAMLEALVRRELGGWI